ncbi:hypothetical protein J7E23_11965 [Pseudomonas sp. ISL-88]|uniref:hypothetical protein n=1 Tax=Bacteria TaxID=2 RepID=UPI001BED21F9|nr:MULTISPECIES: hypothetical protein [Bacteria]MBT2713560.1 hypothetical protein [Pseudomonas sp. ISL-88]
MLPRASAPTDVTLSLAEPLTAALLCVFFIGEKLTAVSWNGLTLIAAGFGGDFGSAA